MKGGLTQRVRETLDKVATFTPDERLSIANELMLNLPAGSDESYHLGGGDIVNVTIHPGGEANVIESELTVAGDGTLDVVHAGRTKVGGLTTSAARDEIRKRLVGSGVYLKPQVSINVKEYGSQGVNVAGAVHKQGRYFLKGPTRLLDVLSTAEGIDDEKAGSSVVIVREGLAEPIKVVRRDLFAADAERVRQANIRVQAGDNVNVPLKARFCVSGGVKDPNCFTLEEGTTLHQAISMAGGLDTETADRKNIVIRRASGAGDVKLDLDQQESGAVAEPLLEPDDQVIVGSREKTQFCVYGPVEKPDCYEYEKGLTLDGAISKAGGLNFELANPKDITVRRTVAGKLQEFKLSIEDTSENGARFRIERDDVIQVAKADCLVTVGGTVATPGTYPLTTGMTITDAIEKGGGAFGSNAWGNLSKVRLLRGNEPARIINVKAIQKGEEPDVQLQCGDKIFVQQRIL